MGICFSLKLIIAFILLLQDYYYLLCFTEYIIVEYLPYRAVFCPLGRRAGGKGEHHHIGDLPIGATALHMGFDVVTINVRHFERIPGLKVVAV